MALDREAIYAALYDRLRALVQGVKKSSRFYLDFEQFTPEQQPAMLVVQRGQTPEEQRDLPPKWRLSAALIFYARAPSDPSGSPDAAMNALVRQAEAALERQPGEAGGGDLHSTTLGGLCQRCWISGEVTYWQGDAGGQSVALIPLEVLAWE